MEPIKALMIIEMIGRPKEHLEETLKEYTKKIGSEKGITLINEKLHEPKKIEHKKEETKDKKEVKIETELFSTFAEIEIESKDVTTLMRIIFAYMPSHIEIISPENLELKNIDFNDLFNEVIRKMHEYDGIAKSMIMQNKIMKERFQEILSNLQKPVIKTEEKKEIEAEQDKQKDLAGKQKNLDALGKEVKIEENANAKPKKSKKKKENN